MQTQPCGHRVVCRLCFVKTIQTAVAQRVLPLRCVVCRTKILKLKQSPPPTSAATSARPRGITAARVTRHGGSGGTGGGGITAAVSPRHSASAGSKLMQPLLIYPALSGGDGGDGAGGRSGTSGASGSCHHHHLPLHPQTVQRRAVTAWTSSAAPPPTTTTSVTVSSRDGSSRPRPAAAAAVGVVTSSGSGRSGRRATSSCSTATRVDSPHTTAPTTTGRAPSTGHDAKKIQRLKSHYPETRKRR